MRFFPFDQPQRLIPFVHLLISLLTTVIICASWGFYFSRGWRVPQYLIDASIYGTFTSEGVKSLQLAVIIVGGVTSGELLLEIVMHFLLVKNLSDDKAVPEDVIWPSNAFLEAITDWSMRFLFIICLLFPPLVMYNAPDNEHKIVYALAFSTIKNTAVVAAAAMSMSDIIDRKLDEHILSFATTLLYAFGEILYYFALMQEPSPGTASMLMASKALCAFCVLVMYVRIVHYGHGIIKSFFKNGALKLRKLSMKEWRFIVYTSLFLFGSLLIFILVGAQNFDYQNTKLTDEAVYHISFVVGGTIYALMPIFFARYEALLAEDALSYSEKKISRAINSSLHAMKEDFDALIEIEDKACGGNGNSPKVKKLMMMALALHTAVDILEEDYAKREEVIEPPVNNDDDNSERTSSLTSQQLVRFGVLEDQLDYVNAEEGKRDTGSGNRQRRIRFDVPNPHPAVHVHPGGDEEEGGIIHDENSTERHHGPQHHSSYRGTRSSVSGSVTGRVPRSSLSSLTLFERSTLSECTADFIGREREGDAALQKVLSTIRHNPSGKEEVEVAEYMIQDKSYLNSNNEQNEFVGASNSAHVQVHVRNSSAVQDSKAQTYGHVRDVVSERGGLLSAGRADFVVELVESAGDHDRGNNGDGDDFDTSSKSLLSKSECNVSSEPKCSTPLSSLEVTHATPPVPAVSPSSTAAMNMKLVAIARDNVLSKPVPVPVPQRVAKMSQTQAPFQLLNPTKGNK